MALSDKYIIPPISIFDTRQGYWTKRKKFWDKSGLYSDNGRNNVLSNSKEVKDGSQTGFKTIVPTTSKFDPVIAEIIYKWFAVSYLKMIGLLYSLLEMLEINKEITICFPKQQ